MLEAAKIKFRIAEYDVDESDLSGVHVAEQLGQAPEEEFENLITKEASEAITELNEMLEDR